MLPVFSHSLAMLPRLYGLSEPALTSAHSFSSTASWLIPQRVLCGRYLGTCPSRPVGPGVVCERLAAIRAAGVSTFVCLQSEEQKQQVRDWFWLRGGRAEAPTRRAVLGSAVAAAALLPRVPETLAVESSRCNLDRCDVSKLMASKP